MRVHTYLRRSAVVNESGGMWTSLQGNKTGMSQSLSLALARPHDTVFVAPEQATDPYVKMGVEYWCSVRGARRFPARADLTLRGMAAVLPYAVIVSVIDGGADYEFRYVGEQQRQAFHTSFKGMRVSQIEAAAPALGAILRGAYEQVRASGTPYVARGAVDHGVPGANPLFHESVFLPLSASDNAVDHLLIVGVQVPEPFWDIAADELTILTEKTRMAGAAL